MSTSSRKIWWQPAEENATLEFDVHTKCSYMDLQHRPGQPHDVKREGSLDYLSFKDWFEKDDLVHATATEGDEIPGSRLRILFATCGINGDTNKPKVSISKNTFRVMKDRLRLPDYFLTNIPRDHLARTTTFSSNTGESSLHGLIFKLAFYRQKFYQVSISYFPNLNLTYGFVLARSTSDIMQPLLALLEFFEGKPGLSNHPLILPTAAVEREIDRTSRRIHRWDREINELEEVMGQHEYEGRPVGNPLEMDFTSKTRRLNHLSKRVGVDILNLAEYEEKRMGILIQAVYQFMAQKDAKVYIELASNSAAIAKASKDDSAIMRQIAIETKRDSSAMKTIALLGMFFLPGTFVAAIFAMPVFNWDGENMPVIKDGFKYYLAVTVPLTILVLVSWGLGTFFPWKKWVSSLIGTSGARGYGLELTKIDS